MKYKVLFEDNHLIIVNKPAGVLVHGDKTRDRTLVDEVKSYIKEKYQKPGAVYLGVIHRLDRPVSGAIVFARTSKALVRMNKLFKDRKIEKIYHALTDHRPPEIEDRITHYILKDSIKNISKAFRSEKNGAKKAILEYELIAEIDRINLMSVNPVTGRPHQIRVQLMTLGCPIIGDLKYGYAIPNKDKSICLHCYQLKFIHPVTGKTISATAPYPNLPVWKVFN
jgi:23S rRNA pseudouridine1911/1915/1917 synthase